MNISQKGIDLIKSFEGLRLSAYLDSVEIPTIGYGTIQYEDGSVVKIGDSITKEAAEKLLRNDIEKRTMTISQMINRPLNQNQFDALVSFAYNLGTGALRKSTLLKKVNADPEDATIVLEFLKWNKAGGKELAGLTKRRQMEADLYFS